MKLAYVNELPREAELQRFWHAYAAQSAQAEAESSARQLSAAWPAPSGVISVYDSQRLIGIGCLRDSLEIHVLPAYRHREIERNVQKLLNAAAYEHTAASS